ncbi:hypothetical protein D3C78_1382260 [compost metagenome]
MLRPLRPEQLRQVLVVGQLARGKGLALVIEQGFFAPTRDRQLFFQTDHDFIRPDPTHFGMGDPRHLLQFRAHAGQVDCEEAGSHIRGNALLHRLLADVTQITLHGDLGDRPVGVRHQPLRTFVGAKTGDNQQHRPEQALEDAEVGLGQARRQRLFGHHPAGTTRHRLAAAGGGLLMT